MMQESTMLYYNDDWCFYNYTKYTQLYNYAYIVYIALQKSNPYFQFDHCVYFLEFRNPIVNTIRFSCCVALQNTRTQEEQALQDTS